MRVFLATLVTTQPGTDTAKFLEIRNNAAAAVSLDSFALRFVNGANNSPI